MKKQLFIMFAVLILTSLLGSCAADNAAETSQGEAQSGAVSEEEPVADAPLLEPEQIISKQEVSDMLGVPVDEGEKSEMTSVGQKTVYYDAQEGEISFLQISLTQPGFMPAGSTITPEETYQGAKAGLGDTSDVDISGIGDECFTGTPGLHIVSDGYYIVIAAGNSDDPSVQEVLKKAGELAVSNLKALISG